MADRNTYLAVHPLQHYPGFEPGDLDYFEAFRAGGAAEPGFITDFLGVRTRASSLANAQRGVAGTVIDIPVPGDYHAEAVEYVGLLKSALAAQGQYVAIELGAGWGPWLMSGGAAARRREIPDIRLYGVEADPTHYEFMRQHFIDNGFDPDQHRLIQAAVGPERGRARWPKVPDPANDWGSRPATLDGDAVNANDAAYLGGLLDDYIDVEILAMSELIALEPLWDLVHVDVQGWEVKIIASALDLLTARARYMIVGTHSRKLDGDLIELMNGAGWHLEHEKPTRFQFRPNVSELESMTVADGTQVWRNPRL